MSSSAIEIASRAAAVAVSAGELRIDLHDGRAISVPIAWFPRLAHATDAERQNWRLIAGGQGIHWDDLDEDNSIESLIAGRASAETQSSLAEWLKSRNPKHA